MDENTQQPKRGELHPIISAFADVDYVPISPSEILRLEEPASVPHVYALMHAVIKTSERSKRTHELASAAIEHNGGNPTAWLLRRQSAEALAAQDKSVWAKELAFCGSVIIENSKNYQAWEHRRFCAKLCGLQHEREFTDVVLAEDEKNYHAWAHRAWLVKQGLKDGELHSTEWYISRDLRNNSAWNHRWMVLTHTGAIEERGTEEMRFALDVMRKASRNEAVWNYIRALCERGIGTQLALDAVRQVLATDQRCFPARKMLVYGPLKQGDEEVKKHCKFLADYDWLRSGYWKSIGEDGEEDEEL